jgi:hypothetical protein
VRGAVKEQFEVFPAFHPPAAGDDDIRFGQVLGAATVGACFDHLIGRGRIPFECEIDDFHRHRMLDRCDSIGPHAVDEMAAGQGDGRYGFP